MTSAHLLLLGLKWTDPKWLFDHFQTEFFWISLAIVFVECGLLFPFLPGDTLLFSVGLFIASTGRFHLNVDLFAALVAFSVAAMLGNLAGYELGRLIGKPLRERDGRLIKRQHLEKTQEFFDRHGNKALVIGRFVPFVRTYITLVAGITRMQRRRFLVWSGVGAVTWVVSITLLGYFLGAAFPSLGSNIDKVVLALLLVSVIPVAWEWRRHRARERARERARARLEDRGSTALEPRPEATVPPAPGELEG